MSTTTIAQFRGDFPEFGSATAYPDTQVQMYLNLAEMRLNQTRWDELWTYGVELYTAHSLALAKMRAATAATGAAPGATTGIVTSKSVGGVSKSSDIGVATVEGAGTYNLTSYGSEFWQLVLQIGIGGVQVGGGDFAGPSGELGSFGIVPYFPFA
ncbi:DUF4054 domain-containing protein [Beijerinckia sp. L45]|uniref:DUF4054 domain-containing protein n=1 Tax=Beijerinckia sp. L45 TaxID=1641855 RepID=UPI00131B9D50|nr:DUF4054 domain-containing protein [Beijerinckia sp. L45]